MLHSIEAFVKPHGVDQEGVTMRQERTREERLKDKAVVLALCARTQLAIGSIGDRLKIQKLCFLVGYPLFEKRVKGLNYTFFSDGGNRRFLKTYLFTLISHRCSTTKRQIPSYRLIPTG